MGVQVILLLHKITMNAIIFPACLIQIACIVQLCISLALILLTKNYEVICIV